MWVREGAAMVGPATHYFLGLSMYNAKHNANKNALNTQEYVARVLLAALAVALYPSLADAAPAVLPNGRAGSVGDMFCNTFYNSSHFPPLFSGLAYITGGWICLRGMWDMMKRSSDPNNKPFKDGILGITMGGFIAALPNTIVWLHQSLFGEAMTGKASPCSNGVTANGDPGTPVPLDEMLANFVQNIEPGIMSVMSGMAVIFGVVMIFYNMIKLSKFGSDAKTNSLTPIIGSLIIGALLVAVGETMNVSLNTLFGFSGGRGDIQKYDSIAYVPGGSFDMSRFDRAMKAVFVFLHITGSLAFIRGFFVMKNALEGSGQATKGQAYTHIIGGALLVNMPGFIQYIEKSVGFKVINVS
jgi:hypothetical protein